MATTQRVTFCVMPTHSLKPGFPASFSFPARWIPILVLSLFYQNNCRIYSQHSWYESITGMLRIDPSYSSYVENSQNLPVYEGIAGFNMSFYCHTNWDDDLIDLAMLDFGQWFAGWAGDGNDQQLKRKKLSTTRGDQITPSFSWASMFICKVSQFGTWSNFFMKLKKSAGANWWTSALVVVGSTTTAPQCSLSGHHLEMTCRVCRQVPRHFYTLCCSAVGRGAILEWQAIRSTDSVSCR